jgi:hypothetical protein
MKKLEQAIEQALKALHHLDALASEYGEPQQAPWDGQGFPPAGTVCEVSSCGRPFEWCEVKYVGASLCVVDHKSYSDQHYHLSNTAFRPVCTEEYNEFSKIIKASGLKPDDLSHLFFRALSDSGNKK